MKTWMAGTSPVMTDLNAVTEPRRSPIYPPPATSGFLALERHVNELSSEGLDGRRRRLLFRCRHRGIREMDFVLGRFADAELPALSDGELDELETWLDIPDQQIFAWVNGSQPTPAQIDTALFRRLCAFHGVAPAPK
jgi:antitoxin CptB